MVKAEKKINVRKCKFVYTEVIYFVFHYCDKHHNQKQLEEESDCFTFGCNPSSGKDKAGTQTGIEAEIMEESWLLLCSKAHLSYQPRPTCLGMVLPIEG